MTRPPLEYEQDTAPRRSIYGGRADDGQGASGFGSAYRSTGSGPHMRGRDDLRAYAHSQSQASMFAPGPGPSGRPLPPVPSTTAASSMSTPYTSYAGPSSAHAHGRAPEMPPGYPRLQHLSAPPYEGGSHGRPGSASRYNPYSQPFPPTSVPHSTHSQAHLPPVPPFPRQSTDAPLRPRSPQITPIRPRSGTAKPLATTGPGRRPSIARSRVKASPAPTLGENDPEGTSGEEGEGGDDKQRLEVKREKNRLKQRNLRMRRANHVSDLEASLEQSKTEQSALQAKYDDLQLREMGLNRYLGALEDVMRQHGLMTELRAVQAAWNRLERDGKHVLPGEADVGQGAKRRKLEPSSVLGTFDQVLPGLDTSRPRTSTSSFQPDRIDTELFAFAAGTGAAPSPRSLRIEDLLSPSFIHRHHPLDNGDHAVPVSAYTIDTPLPAPTSMALHTPGVGAASGPTPTTEEIGSVAMQLQVSSESLGARSAGSGLSGGGVSAVEGYLDGVYPGQVGMPGPSIPKPLPCPVPLALPGPFAADSPGTLAPPPLHQSIYTARILLRMLLAPQSTRPLSHLTLPPLTPRDQTILLNAIYHLTTPAFRDMVNQAQLKHIPPEMFKTLLVYSHVAHADLRVVLMPIAVLRGRIVGFLEDNLPFDVTAFITHVLADARVFGDTADPDAWEMSDTFWDVWSGWFRVGRIVCKSLRRWRRRYGHTGANVIEILLGLEGDNSRMKEMIGRPEGWKRPDIVPMPPDPSVLEAVTPFAFSPGPQPAVADG